MKKSTRVAAVSVMTAAALLGLAGCAKGGASGDAASGTITLWTHNAGNEAELAAIQKIVDDFNASQEGHTVSLQAFPQESYNESVTAAAASKKLPCILDIDGPNVPSWAWAGYLAPIDELTDRLADFLPSTVGTYEDKTYSYGFYDVALTMVTRKSTLDDNGIRVPTPDKPWTKDEFDHALETLKATGSYAYPADFATSSTGEWYPYAYSPFLQSAGGDLIDRTTYESADGVLNGPEALEWANWFQGLVSNGYIAAKSGTDQTADFINGKTAIMYAGSWAAEKVRDAFGDDALFLPSVDLGQGPKIGGGSWQWGMSSGCSDPEGALAYLEFAAQDEYVASVSEATGTIPATDAAAELVPGYEPGGVNDVFRQFSKANAVVRPVTPGYPFISSAFAEATQQLLDGADPQKTLDQAVKDIDANQKQNAYQG
ncbi:sugar ABC transporter substrate-binding protein [Tessaracoccus palaemonis]|uniref:Sugar ABC transporter substrate-binding protein n=1 Tax=Tessaracoccus palaemonis TaxID=2829499 RepID=A0ABX8SGY7_9ACTN|nr:sugar ABC transporter substrate-binding protein [Tessaracoccus palaemonis]QXT62667.1 sugar ABC transporter substrate-binding protein [Tessaracoccus palaemonis]